MTQKIIKHRMFTWFEEADSPVHPGGTVLMERIPTFGQDVDITNPAYVERGESLDAFYSDEQADQIRAGKYNGPDAALLYQARHAGSTPPLFQARPDVQGELQVGDMDAVELAEYIVANRLNVPSTIALAGDSEESINLVLDAENIASENDPRKGVVDALEKKLTAGVPE